MEALASGDGEHIKVGPHQFRMHLVNNDPDVPTVPLADARQQLAEALANLPQLAAPTEHHFAALRAARAAGQPTAEEWTLELDELEETGVELRPRLPIHSELSGSARPLALAAPANLVPLTLDSLTVVDDRAFIETLQSERNLPDYIAPGLKAFYS